MTKVTVDVKQNNKARNIFLALLLCACGALYFLWGSYTDLKASLVKSTENALNEYKAQNDSILVIEGQVDFLSAANETLMLKNDRLLAAMAKQDIKDKKELQKVENLPPSEQIGLFSRITNCEVLQSGNIGLVPVEGIKTANILMTEGEQAKNKVNQLNELILGKDSTINNLTQTDSLKSKENKILKTEFGDAIKTIASQDVLINRQDKRIKTQKTVTMVSGVVGVIMTIIAIIK